MFECMVLCPRCDGRCLDSEMGLHDSSIGYFASRGGGHAFDRWAPSDDAEVFLAHITCCYSAEKSSLAPSTTVVSRDSGGCSSSLGCCGCWEWFVSLCGREAPQKQLYLFVTKENFCRLVGSGASSRREAEEFFDRWLENVPRDRRWGGGGPSSVSVAVDGVFLPRPAR